MNVKVGATGMFVSPYEQYAERNGQAYKVIRIFDKDDERHDISEVGVMYLIQFVDGEQIEAWPEELFPSLPPASVQYILKNVRTSFA